MEGDLLPAFIHGACTLHVIYTKPLMLLAAMRLQVRNPGAGLLAALFMALVPSYISRSVAGSYDNEGVAIFALVNVFYWFVKVIHQSSCTQSP